MSRILWDKIGERKYEIGVDHGVLYPCMDDGSYGTGVAWNGLSAVNENPSGAEPSAIYADNIKYLSIMSAEEFAATVESYTYPDAFAVCVGMEEVVPGVRIAQQAHKPFGMTYRSLVGNDVKNNDYGYKLHLIYNALAAPSEKNHETVNDSPEPGTMSHELSTTPVDVPGYKATAHVEIDSTRTNKAALKKLEDILYGTELTEARLPLPEEVFAILAASEMGLVAEAMDAETNVYGVAVNTLQSDIEIGADTISGTLKKVSNYTGFNNADPSEQEGHFLALSFSAADGVTIQTLVVNGKGKDPVDVTKDGFCVYKISDKDTQRIRFIVKKGGETATKEYSLTGLTLAES